MEKGFEFLGLEMACLKAKLIVCYIQGGPKTAPFLYALTSTNIKISSKLFHCQNQEKICNITITKDPTIPQVYCYTTL